MRRFSIHGLILPISCKERSLGSILKAFAPLTFVYLQHANYPNVSGVNDFVLDKIHTGKKPCLAGVGRGSGRVSWSLSQQFVLSISSYCCMMYKSRDISR